MPHRILCVDDEENILTAFQRTLRSTATVEIATSGAAALGKIQGGTAYALIIADMNMPGMNGIEFLAQARIAAPNSVRMMLTGSDDSTIAMRAINHGSIFRFLTKPCTPEDLIQSVLAGLRQYELLTAERQLLENTLHGATRLLTDILSLLDPVSFGRSEAICTDMRSLGALYCPERIWELELATMLANIGHITIPPVVALHAQEGRALTAVEADMIQRIPEVGSMLVANIPRLEEVARIILHQDKNFDGTGFPVGSTKGEAIPIGARLLRLIKDLHHLEASGTPRPRALITLKERQGLYDPDVLKAAATCLGPSPVEVGQRPPRAITLIELGAWQRLRSDIATVDGMVLISSGHVITPAILERLINFSRIKTIKEPILIEEQSSH